MFKVGIKVVFDAWVCHAFAREQALPKIKCGARVTQMPSCASHCLHDIFGYKGKGRFCYERKHIWEVLKALNGAGIIATTQTCR